MANAQSGITYQLLEAVLEEGGHRAVQVTLDPR